MIKQIFRACLAPNTHGDGTGCDNMTAVIVKFVSTTNLKRKSEEIENNSNENIDSMVTSNDNNGVSEEPQTKRSKQMETEVDTNEVEASV